MTYNLVDARYYEALHVYTNVSKCIAFISELSKPHLGSCLGPALGKEQIANYVQFVTAFASRFGTRDISLCIKLQEGE